jgi:hypothetical protein
MQLDKYHITLLYYNYGVNVPWQLIWSIWTVWRIIYGALSIWFIVNSVSASVTYKWIRCIVVALAWHISTHVTQHKVIKYNWFCVWYIHNSQCEKPINIRRSTSSIHNIPGWTNSCSRCIMLRGYEINIIVRHVYAH